MSRLFGLKKNLSISAAAKHLTSVLGEYVSEADMFEFGLEKHILLSVEFVDYVVAKPCKIILTDNDEKFRGRVTLGSVYTPTGEGKVIVTKNKTVPIIGVFDLLAFNAGENYLIQQYKRANGGCNLDLSLKNLGGAFVVSSGAELYQLHEHPEDTVRFLSPQARGAIFYREDHPDSYISFKCRPVVRTDVLTQFLKSLPEDKLIGTDPSLGFGQENPPMIESTSGVAVQQTEMIHDDVETFAETMKSNGESFPIFAAKLKKQFPTISPREIAVRFGHKTKTGTKESMRKAGRDAIKKGNNILGKR